ncbi:zinc finger matrin-type protein 5-like [Ptychodera flava]|uniref:zinc finger matrin-type protein 5-like n=1 Tax=Ptychodera flava TaxID=63121 RepID=UPI00396A0F57
MGKRYYCDYCDKTFPDNAQSRKKHLDGVHHQMKVKAHYDHFKDSATRLEEELKKTTCRRFVRTGECHFGSNCRFSHLSQAELEAWKAEVEQEKLEKVSKKKKCSTEDKDFSLDEWLAKRDKNKQTSENEPQKTSQKREEADEVTFCLPPSLQTVPNLPPSLFPPPPGGYILNETAEWGW